jgi:hypothetical protein
MRRGEDFRVEQASLFRLGLESVRHAVGLLVDVTARLVVGLAVLEDQTHVLDDFRVVAVLEVVNVVLDLGEVHRLFDYFIVIWRLKKIKKLT